MDDLHSLMAPHDVQDAMTCGDHGAILRLVRLARGLTQAQTGYSVAAVSQFETRARRLADVTTLRRFAAALNITPEMLGLTPEESRVSLPPGATTLATVATSPLQDGDEVPRKFAVLRWLCCV